ncbi:hypothetical protein D8674_012997 [Pyrus ussuriensis x Pyrus communis]|uniref:Uncharacterized protein n=1 Tax=Pyrus ussuriensis x Pyrus communis TaxID=2448454 RepID=A0A5N5GPA7_9ROSA|nr:hypothetical protein D8674_012997 [Pyrus ussuriensis x Pyrus communis]
MTSFLASSSSSHIMPVLLQSSSGISHKVQVTYDDWKLFWRLSKPRDLLRNLDAVSETLRESHWFLKTPPTSRSFSVQNPCVYDKSWLVFQSETTEIGAVPSSCSGEVHTQHRWAFSQDTPATYFFLGLLFTRPKSPTWLFFLFITRSSSQQVGY